MNLIILGVLAQICFINALNIGAATSLLPYGGKKEDIQPQFTYSAPAHPTMGLRLPEDMPKITPGQPGKAANGKDNISPPKPPEASP